MDFSFLTWNRIGPLKDRRIWEDYYAPNRSAPISRFNLLEELLKECNSNHPHCKPVSANDAPLLPTRVLEISKGDQDESLKIKLHVADGERSQYLVLSYCWGNQSPLKTLKSNLQERVNRIAYNDLPLTFQDAVLMTWYTGYRYLWIDSLCIIQDNEDDGVFEAAGTAAVYSNAMLTFAATAAPDGSGGCTFNYNGPMCIHLNDDTALIRYECHLKLDSKDAPLNTRGWTFQEGALSRRLVCFPEDQMLWKCSSVDESKDGLLHLSDASAKFSDSIWNVWACLRQMGEGKPSYTFWCDMMEDYSRRTLTFDKDKLAALAGNVEMFRSLVHDEPAMGLWQETC